MNNKALSITASHPMSHSPSIRNSLKIAVVAIAILGVYLRVPDRFVTPQFWAEDGTILFIQALGGARSLLEPYSGALYTFQRIAALFSVQFPWRYTPAVFMAFTWASFFIIILWCLSSRLPLRPQARIALSLLIAFSPVKNEVYLNLINAHWVFCGLGLLLLIMERPPEGLGARTFDYGAAIVMGLTGPFCLLYAPLFILKVWFRRDQHGFILLMLIAACCLVQITQLHSRAEVPILVTSLYQSLLQIVSAIDFHFLWIFLGYDFAPLRTLSLPVALGGLFLIAILYIAIFCNCIKFGGYEASVPLLASILIVGATAFEFRSMPEAFAGPPRYFFVPVVAFLWAAVLAAQSRPRYFVPLFLIPVVAFISHPSWSEYEMKDLHWKAGSECLKLQSGCTVRIHPLFAPFNVFAPNVHRMLTVQEIQKRENEIAHAQTP
jgi:hypothetical protein